MILAKTWFERASIFSIGYPPGGGYILCLSGLDVFPDFFVCNFSVDMDVGRCFIRSTIRLGNVEKWSLLMAYRRFLRTRINSMA